VSIVPQAAALGNWRRDVLRKNQKVDWSTVTEWGALTDAEIAQRYGVSVARVRQKRKALRIPAKFPRPSFWRQPTTWEAQALAALRGIRSDVLMFHTYTCDLERDCTGNAKCTCWMREVKAALASALEMGW
jgi:hypothetical protein